MRTAVAFAIAVALFFLPGCRCPICISPPDGGTNDADAGTPDAEFCDSEGARCCPEWYDADAGVLYPPVCTTGFNCNPPPYRGFCIPCGEPGQECCRSNVSWCYRTSCSNLTGHCLPE